MLIIADDLSGAADSAVSCAIRGLESLAMLDGSVTHHATEVLAVDANTRGMTAQKAATTTACLARIHIVGDSTIVFKKIDSTLRGHIGAEISALLDVLRRAGAPAPATRATMAVLAPAFPSLGRTTVNGCQYLHGIPLEETDIWKRDGMTGTASVVDRISFAGLSAGLIPIETVRAGDGAIRVAMLDLAGRVDVVVCDAETEEDLAASARASVALGRPTMWAGSAGLVGHLVEAFGLAQPRTSVVDLAPISGPLIYVVGSSSSTSRHQASVLSREDIVTVEVGRSALDGSHPPGVLTDQIAAAFATGKDILLLSTCEGPLRASESDALQAMLARLVIPHLGRIGGIFATGGESARSVLVALGVTALRVLAEIEPGVPLSIAIGPRPLPVVTKAGGFGSDEVMLHCRRALRVPGFLSGKTICSEKARP